MSYRLKYSIAFLSSVIALYSIANIIYHVSTPVYNLFTANAQQPINDANAQMRIFGSVLQHIQNDYVDEPNLEKVRAGALRGLAGGLDPYSSYLTADQVKAFQANQTNKNNQVGIGAEFSQVSSYLYIISVIKNSPAEKAGLKAGDVIEYIENKATRDISLYDARQLMIGAADSKVKLRVLRAGEKPQTIDVTRGSYKIPEAEMRVEAGKVGVIKVFSLETGEAKDIKTKVEDLKKQGVSKIVLDLRGVATGELSEAVDVANLFIKDGTLAQVIGRDNKPSQTFTADAGKFAFDGKVVAIIDLGTSGAAEVVAGAILDRQRGDVVGEKSFGAGAKQELFPLRSGDGLLLTTAKWASPSGKTFLAGERADSGVKPSVEVKRPDTPEPLEVEDLIDQQEQEKQQPNPSASPTPQAAPTPKPSPEDLQLKKALELLQDKTNAAKAGE